MLTLENITNTSINMTDGIYRICLALFRNDAPPPSNIR